MALLAKIMDEARAVYTASPDHAKKVGYTQSMAVRLGTSTYPNPWWNVEERLVCLSGRAIIRRTFTTTDAQALNPAYGTELLEVYVREAADPASTCRVELQLLGVEHLSALETKLENVSRELSVILHEAKEWVVAEQARLREEQLERNVASMAEHERLTKERVIRSRKLVESLL